MIFILYEMLLIPFRLSFDVIFPIELEIFSYIVDFYFLIDIILMFNTAYYDKGNIVLNRKKIVLNYLKFWFWIDTVTSFPYN